MRKFVGAFVVLAVLALLPGFAEPHEPSGRHVGMHPEETINGSIQDAGAEDSLLPGIRAGVIPSSNPSAGDASGPIHFQRKDEPWYAKISSMAAAGIDFIIGAERKEARSGSIDFEVIEGAADLMYRIRVTEFPDFIDGEPEPQVAVGETVFYINVEDGGTEADYRVGGEVQWLFTRNFGLFVEYRFLRPGAETAGLAAASPESDVSSHSVLGGLSFRF